MSSFHKLIGQSNHGLLNRWTSNSILTRPAWGVQRLAGSSNSSIRVLHDLTHEGWPHMHSNGESLIDSLKVKTCLHHTLILHRKLDIEHCQQQNFNKRTKSLSCDLQDSVQDKRKQNQDKCIKPICLNVVVVNWHYYYYYDYYYQYFVGVKVCMLIIYSWIRGTCKLRKILQITFYFEISRLYKPSAFSLALILSKWNLY